MKQKFFFSFINLGCNKNLVDTQYLMGNIFSLSTNNPNYDIQYISDPYNKQTKFVFLNTCGFIKSARDEMFKTIKKLLKAKKTIYLLGCGLQYLTKTQNTKYIKNPNIHTISRNDRENLTIANLLKGYSSTKFHDFKFPKQKIQAYTNASYGFEYLKIAEGCNNACTFCIIPKLRGKVQSKTIQDIIKEAKQMIKNGIKEIILIAQDTSRYGIEKYGKSALFTLLKKIDKIPGNFKYRLLYLYPDIITLNEIKKLKTLKKFIPYFDIPFQHISQNILKKMGRLIEKKQIAYQIIIKEIKKIFPKSYIRTNIIIGFPGETEKDFQELKKFIKESDFDNITLFEYHDEPLASAYQLPNKIPNKIIKKRFLKLKKIVNKKLTAKKKTRIGKTFKGYVMGIKSAKKLIVRPELHAPEIDPYDTININQIKKIYNTSGSINIGDKISYIL